MNAIMLSNLGALYCKWHKNYYAYHKAMAEIANNMPMVEVDDGATMTYSEEGVVYNHSEEKHIEGLLIRAYNFLRDANSDHVELQRSYDLCCASLVTYVAIEHSEADLSFQKIGELLVDYYEARDAFNEANKAFRAALAVQYDNELHKKFDQLYKLMKEKLALLDAACVNKQNPI